MVGSVRSMLRAALLTTLLLALLAAPAQAEKTAICHKPGTTKLKVLSVGNEADHMAHGDFVVGEQCLEGVGACEARGVTQCVAGDFCSAVPGDPSAEVCNGLDDDCDGLIDLADEADCLDRDGDGVVNSADNCPTVPNPTQDAAACDCPCFTHTDIDTDPPRAAPASPTGAPCVDLPLTALVAHDPTTSNSTRGYSFITTFIRVDFFCFRAEEPTASAGFLETISILDDEGAACRALIVNSDLWQQCP